MQTSLTRSIVRLVAGSAAVIAGITGCGGSDPVGADGLSGSDVHAMVIALNGIGAFSFDLTAPNAQPLVPGLALQMRTQAINHDVVCAGGGSIHVAGTFDTYFSGVQAAYVADVTQQHIACQTLTVNGRGWTFDGNPNVALHTEYVINSATHVVRMIGTFRGSLKWKSTTGGTGVCAADIKLSSNAIPPTRNEPGNGAETGQITGTICTRKVDVHY